jgi:SAM-dependent methyltransferase
VTYQSFDGHGVDVAVKRADDLDHKVLEYIATNPDCQALDLGSGAGGQSVRMAAAGARVTAIDQYDFGAQFAKYEQSIDKLQFRQGDIQHISSLALNKTFDIGMCQRTIHYLPYSVAVAVLKDLSRIINDRLFISVTGSGSLVGDTYPCATTALAERFCELTELGKEMFSINEPVCLYNQAEFIQLLESAGWTVDECWESAFGNIKAVCSK